MAAALLIDAPAVSEGIKRGLSISAGVLIPSLFPFMTLCGFISATDLGRVLALPLGFLTRKVYRLPRDMGDVVLMSMIGGYPAGARMLSESLARGKIDAATASRALCFCVNAGPSFLITAVGSGMFLDGKAGIILFGTQIFATLVTGALFSAGSKSPVEAESAKPGEKVVSAFVLAVTGASSSMISLCAFAVFFSGMLGLVNVPALSGFLGKALNADEKIIAAIIGGIFEVTSGCVSAAGKGGAVGFALASASVSFGGLSVIFQIAALFRDKMITLKPFLLSRLVHMALSCPVAYFLYRNFCAAKGALAPVNPPEMLANNGTLIISVCLIGMCTVLVLSAEGLQRQGKRD